MKVFIVFALAAVAFADRAPPPSYGGYQQPTYADTPPQYQYSYAVQDSYSGVDFNANENRDNYATNGEYRVVLPDGRTQIVTYRVDDAYSGFVADVRYEGTARYDEPAPYRPAPRPSYAPAPAPSYPPPKPSYN